MRPRLPLLLFGTAGTVLVLRAAAGKRRRVQSRPNRNTSATNAYGRTGMGLAVVVNVDSGSASDGVAEQLRAEFPEAEIVTVEDPELLADAVARAAESNGALGIAGGDGSVGAAAMAALSADKPLVVFPAGTLNHFARDLGIESMDDGIEAARQRQVMKIDLGSCGDEVFVNTFAIGVYTDIVLVREHLENRIGKWPAVLVALVWTLFRAEPCRVRIDDVERNIWMVFAGNGVYKPNGLAPGWREDLSDGLLDVRIVSGDHPFARFRLIAAVVSGRLGRSKVYSQQRVPAITIDGGSDLGHIAVDGEVLEKRVGLLRLTKSARVGSRRDSGLTFNAPATANVMGACGL